MLLLLPVKATAGPLLSAACLAQLLTAGLVSAQASSELSVGAAVGISVAVSVTVCVCIAALVICFLARRWRRGSGRPVSSGYENRAAASADAGQSQSLRFSEEGRGVSAGAGSPDAAQGVNETASNSKKAASNKETAGPEVHHIAVKVASPDDLRFKVCRSDEGQILVATDPAHSALCSREGIRSGDRILGVYVDIQGSPHAHPKEVSELLSLASDYRLVVDFQHLGAVLRGPPAAPRAGHLKQQHQRPISAAEKALRKQRDRSVEVVDGGGAQLASADAAAAAVAIPSIVVETPRKKPRAPEPPAEDRDSLFAIRDRRKRRSNLSDSHRPEHLLQPQAPEADQQEQQDTVDDGGNSEDAFERLCETLTVADTDEAEWRQVDAQLQLVRHRSGDSSSSSGSDGSGSDSDSGPKAPAEIVDLSLSFADEVVRGKTWRSLPSGGGGDGNDEEEEKDGESENEAEAEEQIVQEESLARLEAGISQQQQPSPMVERNYDHYELEEQDVVTVMDPPSALRPVVDCCTQFDGCLEDRTDGPEPGGTTDQWEPATVWECLPNHPLPAWAGDGRAAWESLPNAKLQQPKAAELTASLPLLTTDAVTCQAVRSVSPSLARMAKSSAAAAQADSGSRGSSGSGSSSSTSSVVAKGNWPTASAAAVELGAGPTDSDDHKADLELSSYLERVATNGPYDSETSSTASSSVRTVQEESAVEVVMATESSPRSRYRRDDSLEELSRSMALRDVEVATVILLDSEEERRRRQRAGGDSDGASSTAASSGRSTVQEDCIDPVRAPDRQDADADADATAAALDEAEAAALLNDDFDLAAAAWEAGEEEEEEAAHRQEEPALLDDALMREIVRGAETIWSADDNPAEAAAADVGSDAGGGGDDGDDEELAVSADFQEMLLHDDSQLTGDGLDRLLRQLEEEV